MAASMEPVSLTRNIDTLGASAMSASMKFESFGQNLARGAITMENFGAYTAQATKKVLVWQVAIMAVYSVLQKVGETIDVWKDIELSMARIAITTQASGQALKNYFSQVADIAIEMGMPIERVTKGFDLALRATAKLNDGLGDIGVALTLTRDATVLTNLAGLDYASSMDLLVGSLRQTGLELDEGISLLDKWVAVSQNAATDVHDLSQGFAIMAGAARAAGLNVDQINALVGTMTEATTLGAKEAGNAVRALMSTIYNQESIKMMEKYGIAVRDSNDELRSYWDIMSQLSAIKQTGVLDESAWMEIAKAAGAGQRRYAQFIALLDNFTRAYEILNISANDNGEALEANTKIIETLSNRWQAMISAQYEMLVVWGEETKLMGALSVAVGALGSGFEYASSQGNNLLAIIKPIVALAGVLGGIKILQLMGKQFGIKRAVAGALSYGAGEPVGFRGGGVTPFQTGHRKTAYSKSFLKGLERNALMEGATSKEISLEGQKMRMQMARYSSQLHEEGLDSKSRSVISKKMTRLRIKQIHNVALQEESDYNLALANNRLAAARSGAAASEVGVLSTREAFRGSGSRGGALPGARKSGGFRGLFPYRTTLPANFVEGDPTRRDPFTAQSTTSGWTMSPGGKQRWQGIGRTMTQPGRGAGNIMGPGLMSGMLVGAGVGALTGDALAGVGSGIGTAAGLALGGPVGALAGAAIGGVIGHAITDIMNSQSSEEKLKKQFSKVFEGASGELAAAGRKIENIITVAYEGSGKGKDEDKTDEEIKALIKGAKNAVVMLESGAESYSRVGLVEPVEGGEPYKYLSPSLTGGWWHGDELNELGPTYIEGGYKTQQAAFAAEKGWKNATEQAKELEVMEAGGMITPERRKDLILDDGTVLIQDLSEMEVSFMEAYRELNSHVSELKLNWDDATVSFEKYNETYHYLSQEQRDALVGTLTYTMSYTDEMGKAIQIANRHVDLQQTIADYASTTLSEWKEISSLMGGTGDGVVVESGLTPPSIVTPDGSITSVVEGLMTSLKAESITMSTEDLERELGVLTGLDLKYSAYKVNLANISEAYGDMGAAIPFEEFRQLSMYYPELMAKMQSAYEDVNTNTEILEQFATSMKSVNSIEGINIPLNFGDGGDILNLSEIEKTLNSLKGTADDVNKPMIESALKNIQTARVAGPAAENAQNLFEIYNKRGAAWDNFGDVEIMDQDKIDALSAAIDSPMHKVFIEMAKEINKFDKTTKTFIDPLGRGLDGELKATNRNTWALEQLSKYVDENTTATKGLEVSYNVPSWYKVPTKQWYQESAAPVMDKYKPLLDWDEYLNPLTTGIFENLGLEGLASTGPFSQAMEDAGNDISKVASVYSGLDEFVASMIAGKKGFEYEGVQDTMGKIAGDRDLKNLLGMAIQMEKTAMGIVGEFASSGTSSLDAWLGYKIGTEGADIPTVDSPAMFDVIKANSDTTNNLLTTNNDTQSLIEQHGNTVALWVERGAPVTVVSAVEDKQVSESNPLDSVINNVGQQALPGVVRIM